MSYSFCGIGVGGGHVVDVVDVMDAMDVVDAAPTWETPPFAKEREGWGTLCAGIGLLRF